MGVHLSRQFYSYPAYNVPLVNYSAPISLEAVTVLRFFPTEIVSEGCEVSTFILAVYYQYEYLWSDEVS